MKSTIQHNRGLASVLLLVGALVATLTGCAPAPASSPDSSGGDADAPPRIAINALVVPTFDSLVAYVAEEEGYFDKQGLDVTINVGAGGKAIIDALLAGDAQVGIANYATLISGATNGLPLSVVAAATVGAEDDFQLWTMPDSGIDSLSDLAGRTIGVIATGSIADLLVDVQLASVGLASSDVTYVAIPTPNFVSALTSKQVDAVFMPSLTALQAEQEGGKYLSPGFSGESELLPVAGFVANNSWISEHPDVPARFEAAILEAAQHLADDPGIATELIPTFTSVTADQVPDLALPTWASSLTAEDVERVADLMLEYGQLSQPFDASIILAP